MRQLKIGFGVAMAGLLASFLLRPQLSEAEQVELYALRDIRAAQLVNGNMIRSSPRLMLEMLVHRSNDPAKFYREKFEADLKRLQELGVVEDRDFKILGTNGKPAKIDIIGMFKTNDPLWLVSGPRENGTISVRARRNALVRWEKLEREYAAKGRSE